MEYLILGIVIGICTVVGVRQYLTRQSKLREIIARDGQEQGEL